MKLFNLDDKKQNKLLTALQVILPFTFIFKMWYLAELQYNGNAQQFGALFGRIMSYAFSGAFGYLLALLAVGWSYNMLSRSKYCPCDEMSTCTISKKTYYSIAYFVICIANVVCGLINFVAYAEPIATSFVVILIPTLMSIFSVITIVALLSHECKKDEFKQLLTSMALPCIILLLMLR